MAAFRGILLKVLAVVMIGLGVVCLAMGAVDLGLHRSPEYHFCEDHVRKLTLASVPMLCGIWFTATGIEGICMFLRKKSFKLLRIAFLIQCMLCGIQFGPLLCFLETYIYLMRRRKATSRLEWLLPLLIAALALLGTVLALIALAVNSCCNKKKSRKNKRPLSGDTGARSGRSSGTHSPITSEVFSTKETPLKTPVSPSHVTARREDNGTASPVRLENSQQSNSGAESWNKNIREPRPPPKRWLQWQPGIPGLAKLAQVSVKWQNKVRDSRNTQSGDDC